MPSAVRTFLRGLPRRALSAARACKWGLAVTVVAYGMFYAMFISSHQNAPGSDGFYTWLWARSIAFDHDIDLRNDYALCGDPAGKNRDPGTGHADNPFYVGPSVVWVPVLELERAIQKLPASAPLNERQACVGPLTQKTLSTAVLLGALTVWLMYWIGRRWAGDGAAALAAGLLGLGSSLPAYAGIMPSYSHVHDAFWAGASILAALRAAERPRAFHRWLLTGVLLGIGMLQRPVSVVHGVVPGVLAIAALWRERGALLRAFVGLGAGGFLCGALPQMLVWKYLYGTYYAGAPHGRFFMQYGHAHPWLLLFAPHGGFFYLCPGAWFGVMGLLLALRARDKRVLIAGLFVACAAAVWLSSAAIDWSGSGTYGARRLTSMLPLVALPTALGIARVSKWLRARPARALAALGVAVLVPIAFTVLGGAYGLSTGQVPTDYGLSQAQLYGAGDQISWTFLDDNVGDVAVLPAELVYSLRFGLPMNTFRETSEAIYFRDYRTMAMGPHDIDLTKGQHKHFITGFFAADDGAHLIPGIDRGTVVFAAQWPFATSLSVRAHGSAPGALLVGRGGPFGARTWYGKLTVDTKETTTPLPIPKDGFDSGILEIVFQRVGGTGDVVISNLSFDDTNTYPPPL